jgi:hypothetical protein
MVGREDAELLLKRGYFCECLAGREAKIQFGLNERNVLVIQ